jgi:hypothetical protein
MGSFVDSIVMESTQAPNKRVDVCGPLLAHVGMCFTGTDPPTTNTECIVSDAQFCGFCQYLSC